MNKIIVIAIVLIAASANAKILSIYTSLKNTTEEAALIVIGKVTDIKFLGDDRLAVITVEKVLKGEALTKEVEVFFYGPLPSGIRSDVDEEVRMLQFSKNERCIVFLYERKSLGGYYHVVNHDHGKLRIFETEKGKMIKPPFYFIGNDKLNEVESLETIIRLIKRRAKTR